MKLQILIPHYKETANVIKPLLDSIALQQSVPMEEIGVIICHDGSDVFNSIQNDKNTCPIFLFGKSDNSFFDYGYSIPITSK